MKYLIFFVAGVEWTTQSSTTMLTTAKPILNVTETMTVEIEAPEDNDNERYTFETYRVSKSLNISFIKFYIWSFTLYRFNKLQ